MYTSLTTYNEYGICMNSYGYECVYIYEYFIFKLQPSPEELSLMYALFPANQWICLLKC